MTDVDDLRARIRQLAKELREARKALEALKALRARPPLDWPARVHAALTGASWAFVDDAKGLIWFKPLDLAQALGVANGGFLSRVGVRFVVFSEKRRTHPVTGARLPRRERWAAVRATLPR